jgi:hypothetical protein
MARIAITIITFCVFIIMESFSIFADVILHHLGEDVAAC